MAEAKEQILFENAAYRLSSNGLQQEGLSARLEGVSKLIIAREGGEECEVNIPPVPAGYTGMRSSIPVLTAMYNMAINELVANIRPDGHMLAGANWHTVWTRDIASAAALGAVYAVLDVLYCKIFNK